MGLLQPFPLRPDHLADLVVLPREGAGTAPPAGSASAGSIPREVELVRRPGEEGARLADVGDRVAVEPAVARAAVRIRAPRPRRLLVDDGRGAVDMRLVGIRAEVGRLVEVPVTSVEAVEG